MSQAKRGVAKGVDSAIVVDDELIARLSFLGEAILTEEECAVALGLAEPALAQVLAGSRDARSAYGQGRVRALESLRRAQFRLAQTNAAMARFLGQVLLGQSVQRKDANGAEGFDVAGASERLQARLAAIAEAAPGDDDPDGPEGAGG